MQKAARPAYLLLAVLTVACAQPSPSPPTTVAAAAQTTAPADRHPLDALSAPEIEAAAKLLRAAPQFPVEGLFSTIVLDEPPKSDVLAFTPGAPIARQAFAIVIDRRGNKTFEAVTDLNASRVVSWTEVKGVQPPILSGEYDDLSRIVKANAEWQAAMRKRGITDMATVQVDGWAVGQVAAAHQAGPALSERFARNAREPRVEGRLMRAVTYLVGGQTNFYGRPIEGVVALVNMNTGEVVEVVDSGVVPVPPPSQELDEKSTGIRTAPKRLAVTQPGGPSFTINGQEIRWQKWRFRYTLHPREGLVLHTVGYEDGDRVRPILYRASLSEMVVPYGDSDLNWRWRAAFDVGEYNVGRQTSSIEEHTDAPEHATLLDATFADDEGKPQTLPRAVGIYERDGGMLWKHYDMYSRRNESRRARHWLIVNTGERNALGHHPSYILVPGANALPYVAPNSPVRKRAGFINNHFWATRYRPGEWHAAGPYPNQSKADAGLPRWIADDESLANQDVVVWYTLGITHIPRPEEWPIMTAAHVGFRLIPGGFFARNPALDVPACKTAGACP